MTFDNFKTHFSTEISKSLVRYVTDVALKESRYLFTKSVVGVQYAYCTHCNQQHRPLEKLKHKQQAKCPSCKSDCKVQAAGLGRKHLQDRAIIVWYERSRKDSHSITARILSVSRDYSIDDFTKVQTVYNCSHMYLFEPGNSYYFQLGCYGDWKQRTSTYSAFDNHFSGMFQGKKCMSVSNIRSAVKGTPFQYSTWEQYTKYKNPRYVTDMVEFFDLASKYPCIEYLTKSGLRSFVDAKLYKEPTYGAIYWKGKTLQKVLRLTKQELKELRESGLSFKPKHIRFFQKSKKSGMSLSLADCFILAEIDDPFYKTYLDEASKLTTKENAFKYLLKQVKNGHFESATSALTDWRDYQSECKQLGIDLSEEHNLFPNNLSRAHQKTTSRIKLKKDKKLNKQIAERLNELNKFKFEQGKFLLRPAESSVELFIEGRELKHCVGRYAKDYADGKTNIFFVRRLEDPDTSFYTLEIKEKRVVQCRGLKNSDMTDEVRSFVNAFVQKKLLTKKQTRIDVTGIQPRRDEVAV